MRFLVAAACAALLAAGPALAAPSERELSLDQIAKGATNLMTIMPLGKIAASQDGKTLLALNPGREADIAPLLVTLDSCLTTVTAKLDFGPAIAAVADRPDFSNDDLRKIAAFYDDPEMQAMLSRIGSAGAQAEPTAKDLATLERMQAMLRDPAVKRFSDAMGTSPAFTAAMQSFLDGVQACRNDLGASAGGIGLKVQAAKP